MSRKIEKKRRHAPAAASSSPSGAVAPGPSSRSAGPPVLELRELCKRREKGEQVFELRVPSIRIMPGEFVAVAGESGCGKSTLLDMLGLVLSPTSADMFTLRTSGVERPIMGLAPRELAAIRRSELGYILQTGGLLPFLRVRDNILLPRRINGLDCRAAHVERICERLKIANQLNKKPAFLSGGQRQRVAIARALAHEPPLVLADEPTAAVDKLNAREIRDTFQELTRQMGVTVIMVTHDLELVGDVADRIFTFDVQRVSEHVTKAVCRGR